MEKLAADHAGEPVRLPTGASDPQSKAQGFSHTWRVIALNRLLAAYLVLLIAFDLIFERTNHIVLDAVLSTPLAMVLMVASTRISRAKSPSRGWLRISGWTCAALGLVAALAVWTSLSESVSVPWVLLAATLAAGMAYAAWYQLVRVPRHYTRIFVLERLRRGYRRKAA